MGSVPRGDWVGMLPLIRLETPMGRVRRMPSKLKAWKKFLYISSALLTSAAFSPPLEAMLPTSFKMGWTS